MSDLVEPDTLLARQICAKACRQRGKEAAAQRYINGLNDDSLSLMTALDAVRAVTKKGTSQ